MPQSFQSIVINRSALNQSSINQSFARSVHATSAANARQDVGVDKRRFVREGHRELELVRRLRTRSLTQRCPIDGPVHLAIQSIYGIGPSKARVICGDLGLNPNTPLQSINQEGFIKLRTLIEARFEPKHIQEKALGQRILAKIKIGSYQGIRHTQLLPVHGQRTQTNAKNAKKFARIRASAFQLPLFNKKKGQKVEAAGAAKK